MVKNEHVQSRENCMENGVLAQLSRRERQVMTVLFAHSPATVSEILERIPEDVTYSAVRSTLRVLTEKEHVVRETEGKSYRYRPRVRQDRARNAALRDLVTTFFDGSAERAAAALIGMADGKNTEELLDRLRDEIDAARGEGR